MISPDFPPGSEQEREITNACAVVPVEVPGVVGVTATGDLGLKSFYSSYGISTADVAAPGGDSILQLTAAAPNGRALSTYPAGRPCRRPVVDPSGATYCYLQGTSMAGPHVAGVAALIISTTGKSGGAVAAALQQATNPLACPDIALYEPFPQNSGEPQECTGRTRHNSFYGAGEIDAPKLSADDCCNNADLRGPNADRGASVPAGVLTAVCHKRIQRCRLRLRRTPMRCMLQCDQRRDVTEPFRVFVRRHVCPRSQLRVPGSRPGVHL